MDKLRVTFVGAPVYEATARALVTNAGATWGGFRANFSDAVPQILGGNGNIFQIGSSILAMPRLFMNGCASVHSPCSYRP